MRTFAKRDPFGQPGSARSGKVSPFRTYVRSFTLQSHPRSQDQGPQERMQAAGIQGKLTVGAAGDVYEHEADRVANQVMRSPGPEACSCGGHCPKCQGKISTASHNGKGAAPLQEPLVAGVLREPGKPLDAATRTDMESRFGHEFGRVRVHADGEAAESARHLSARAYTAGDHVVFGAGEYAPGTSGGRWLLAHELTHVAQQSSGRGPQAGAQGVVQRAPTISILPETSKDAPTASQRKAAKSCPITCCDKSLGTLHAMPLFYHKSRGAIVAAGSAEATGIGSELHFIADAAQPAAGDLCHCNDFRMIQILTTNVPMDARGKDNFVDNDSGATPFYGDVGRSGKGEHEIPAGYVDAGEKIKTTESIYDRPYKTPAMIGAKSLSWMAETCVTCIKDPKPDRVLGCVTYGFTQNYNKSTSSFDPVVGVSPSCLDKPSANFVSTLSTDSSTTSYKFKSAPDAAECKPPAAKPPAKAPEAKPAEKSK